MDYNKLMEELGNCLGLEKSATESFQEEKKDKAAFGKYSDSVEEELAESLGLQKSQALEEIDEEDLVFEESEPEAEEPEVEKVEEKSPEEIFKDSLNSYYESLLEELDEKEATAKIYSILDETFVKDEQVEAEEMVDTSEVGEKLIEEETDLIKPVFEETVNEDNYTDDPEKQKEIMGETVEELANGMDIKNATESTNAFEEYCRDREAKMLNRYKQLAEKSPKKKSIAVEGLGTVEVAVDEQAIAKTSNEFGYSGKNLTKMVVEAIQKGVI